MTGHRLISRSRRDLVALGLGGVTAFTVRRFPARVQATMIPMLLTLSDEDLAISNVEEINVGRTTTLEENGCIPPPGPRFPATSSRGLPVYITRMQRTRDTYAEVHDQSPVNYVPAWVDFRWCRDAPVVIPRTKESCRSRAHQSRVGQPANFCR